MITVKVTGLQQATKNLLAISTDTPRDMKRLMGTARRRAASTGNTAARAVYNVNRNRLASAFTVLDAGDLTFLLKGARAPISLLSYGARQVSRGLSVIVKKARGRSLIKSGFINPSPQGALVPWKRTGAAPRRMQAGRYKGEDREPIAPLYGPSAADMLLNPEVGAKLQADFVEKVGKEIQRLIDRNLARRG